MTSEHTPEPWKVFKSADGTKLLGVGSAETAEGITDYRGGIWASEDEGLANARRIVACVNACAGIKTRDLEKGGEGWIFPIVEDFVQDTATASENVKRMYDCATTNKVRADAAEVLLETMTDILESYAGKKVPKYVQSQVADARAFLAETAPKPVRLGDEGEG